MTERDTPSEEETTRKNGDVTNKKWWFHGDTTNRNCDLYGDMEI